MIADFFLSLFAGIGMWAVVFVAIAEWHNRRLRRLEDRHRRGRRRPA